MVYLRPVIKFLSFSTAGALRLFGIKGERGEELVTEGEVRMAVALDEYGGFSGVVTSEDIIEETGNVKYISRSIFPVSSRFSP